MTDIHVTRELLEAVSRGEISERFLSHVEAQHLANLCPCCREEIRAWEAKKAARPEHAFAFHALPVVLARHAPELEARWRRAEEDLAALLAVPREERRARIERARSRFRGPFLAELLIEESRRRIPADPGEARHLAELARFVIHRSPGVPESFDLVALATASMANASRAGGDLCQAEEHFRYARYVVTHQGVTNPRVIARIDHLEGSLRKDQRRFAEAESLLTRAAMLYRISGETAGTARVLLKLGSVYFYEGLLHRAIATVRIALEIFPQEADLRLYLIGRHNLAVYLSEAGRHPEAADLLEISAPLYACFPEPWTQLRLSWLRGKIAAGMGDAPAAERWLLEARDGFVRQGIGYDAAMVSLDLALLYLKEGRTGEVRRVAEEMAPIFAAQDVHREATAALLLFQDAARREEVTAELVREVAAYLEAARADPSLRFRQKP